MCQNKINFPVLYSLQNCPYAIRTRFILFRCKKEVLIRAIKLNNKPNEMLIASPKGTVPVLITNEQLVLDESLHIMLWALESTDPMNLLQSEISTAKSEMITLIKEFDVSFIPALEAYCCAKRYHEINLDDCRKTCEIFLHQFELRLAKHDYLYSMKESLLDIALFPFIRKFARVERSWYRQSPYPNLRNWLDKYLQSPSFTKVMEHHDLWMDDRKDVYFGK